MIMMPLVFVPGTPPALGKFCAIKVLRTITALLSASFAIPPPLSSVATRSPVCDRAQKELNHYRRYRPLRNRSELLWMMLILMIRNCKFRRHSRLRRRTCHPAGLPSRRCRRAHKNYCLL